MSKISLTLTMTALVILVPKASMAQVHYEQGRRIVDGVTLLQDYHDDNRYYYVPPFPRLARKSDGTFDLLVVKYVSERADAESSGGLFHALFTLALPPDLEESLEQALREEVSGAVLAGPVPLRGSGDDGLGTFTVVSSVLADTSTGSFTRSLVTSGAAPFSPGAKAAVAARLDQEGSTILWDTFEAPTSDVSVAVSGYYEAVLEGYNARVTADVSTLYEHFSEVRDTRSEFTVGSFYGNFERSQIRNIVDSLSQQGGIQVEVLDRTAATEFDTTKLAALQDLVTTKLIDLMFTGDGAWMKPPKREQAVGSDTLRTMEDRNQDAEDSLGTGLARLGETLTAASGGAGVAGALVSGVLIPTLKNTGYQRQEVYQLKNRRDIRLQRFELVLSGSTSILAPFATAGNLGGLYEQLGGDEHYFDIVNLGDPAFDRQTVMFEVDPEFVPAFGDFINAASVIVVKDYGEDEREYSVVFRPDSLREGLVREVTYPLLGQTGPERQDYRYKVHWSLRGGGTVSTNEWSSGNGQFYVALAPPFRRRVVEVRADREILNTHHVRYAVVEFGTELNGDQGLQRRVRVSPDDVGTPQKVSLYHDPTANIFYRVIWTTEDGEVRGSPRSLEAGTLDDTILVDITSTAVQDLTRD